MRLTASTLSRALDRATLQNSNTKEIVSEFVLYLKKKKLLKMLPSIIRNLKAINKQSMIIVYSTFVLDAEQLISIKTMALKKFDLTGDIEVKNIIDKTLIGGVKIAYRDQEIDLSIKNQISKLKR